MCCPDPQFVSLSTCGTFTTTGADVATGVTVFNNTGGPALSGYVTLTNLSLSADSVFLANNETNIIGPITPGNSQTVFVPNIETLVVFSDTVGLSVTGSVSIEAARRVA
ncbi:S-Ena type endospore appendage [Bacillus cereus]|uniref:S-Ena type endospore appendage n=1 Tax=Bacillus cereus TaxID=1396 RepID=UPI0018CF4C9A|nr:S-Ena type endospore appendage [Bacillus cereus]MBG9618034.1 hypothetical protein [Bacillus cereus]